jgi:hypothetical protein
VQLNGSVATPIAEMGQTLHFCDVRVVSAFHPIATKSRTCRHVGFGPATEVAGLFDHFIGTHQKRLGDREAKRLCGGEIDDKIELAGQFDRDVLGLDAL